MEFTAVGKKVKDVNREGLPPKRKPAEVNEVCDVGSDMVINIPNAIRDREMLQDHPHDPHQLYGGNAH